MHPGRSTGLLVYDASYWPNTSNQIKSWKRISYQTLLIISNISKKKMKRVSLHKINMHPGSSTARLVSNAFCSTEVKQSTTTKYKYSFYILSLSLFLGLGSSKQGKMWPIMFGHILFLTARPALCHLSLYFCFTSTDARKRATFSAFQKK